MNRLNTLANEFELLFFSTNQSLVTQALHAGVNGIMIDWENQGKKIRQQDFDTQINHDTYEDLIRIREITPKGQLLCRINGFCGAATYREIDLAIQGGADEVFIPMVTNPAEVEQILNHCNGSIPLSILIETKEALNWIDEFSTLPLKRIYVGLTDLHIQQRSPNLFYPLVDQTIDRIRNNFSIPLGVGGVTTPNSGSPIPSSFLIKEYARLGVNFSFLRRTFIRDSFQQNMSSMVQEIKAAHQAAQLRSGEKIQEDYLIFKQRVISWVSNPTLP